MSASGIFLDYRGPVDLQVIELLLKKLKKTKEFAGLNKTTAKRAYAIVVECLENIARHSVKKFPENHKFQSFILVEEKNDKIVIRAGNPIEEVERKKLTKKLTHINQMEHEVLTGMYENMINKEPLDFENGAGLGFIILRLKSGNKIDFSFNNINKDISDFNIDISINKSVMRKLIIDQTTNSPGVILDPENSKFEISGESRPPDVGNFYGEILRWMDDYSQHLVRSYESKDPVVFNFNLEYFNSSSAKYILDFCKQIATVRLKGKDMTVKWNYEADDMDMLEVGREMSRMAKFPFEFIQKS